MNVSMPLDDSARTAVAARPTTCQDVETCASSDVREYILLPTKLSRALTSSNSASDRARPQRDPCGVRRCDVRFSATTMAVKNICASRISYFVAILFVFGLHCHRQPHRPD